MANANKEYKALSVTTARGYLNSVRKQGDYYFADINLYCGTKKEKDENDKLIKKFQRVSCIVSKSLHMFCECIGADADVLNNISMNFEIHNLYFEVSDTEDKNGKNYLNGSGSLQEIAFR